MEGELNKYYFKFEVSSHMVSSEDVFNCLSKNLKGLFLVSEHCPEKEENQAIKEMRESAKPRNQQSTVPIQFVWHDGTLSHIDAVNAESWICFENCTVEQIGAVLYVRGE